MDDVSVGARLERVDLFVDESGQDTIGKLFIVAVIAVKNTDESRQRCESLPTPLPIH